MWKEFRAFLMKGNILDMAVGVIIGGAFSKIVTSLVNDIMIPLLGVLTGGADFSGQKFVLSPEVLNEAGEIIKAESAIKYGSFIQNIIDFLIIATCIFFATKAMMKVAKKLHLEKEATPAPKKPTTEELLTEIVGLMKEEKKDN